MGDASTVAALGTDVDGFIKPTLSGFEKAEDFAKLEEWVLAAGQSDPEAILHSNAERVISAAFSAAEPNPTIRQSEGVIVPMSPQTDHFKFKAARTRLRNPSSTSAHWRSWSVRMLQGLGRHGFNTIWRPHPLAQGHDRFLELTSPPRSSNSPRSTATSPPGPLMPDINMFGLTYMQQIEGLDPREGLHIQPGIWAHVRKRPTRICRRPSCGWPRFPTARRSSLRKSSWKSKAVPRSTRATHSVQARQAGFVF